jgi:predicted nuclease of restriction endonuclease-like RecB superfamily
VLTKDLLRVSRRGGGFQPEFAGREHRPLAARVLGTFQGHVGQRREQLEVALTDLEREAEDFKLVRGFAKLVEREATFGTEAPLPPDRARRRAFEAAESVEVVSEDERERALARAADGLRVDPEAVDESLYADLASREVIQSVDARWDPHELLAQYDLSLAQTALFDATEVRVRSSDPKALVSAVKRLGLLYEIRKTGDGREVVATGPDALFRRTRRYGTRFARLLRTVATAESWTLEATIDDRGTGRTMRLSDDDPVAVPGTDPVAEVTFDSGVEADFAARFEALDLDWALTREPEPLETGSRVMIPDFAFDYRPSSIATGVRANEVSAGSAERRSAGGSSDSSDGDHADFRVYFEIMGFWTPEYVEKKLAQLDDLEDVELLVAVDESLGVGEDVEDRAARAIPYSGTVRVKDVRDALRPYEDDLVAASAADLPAELVPDDDVVTLADLAARHGVSEDAIEDEAFPEHERVGRTLVRPVVLETLEEAIADGMAYDEAEEVLGERCLADASAALSRLGFRVEWEGLGGGTVREK